MEGRLAGLEARLGAMEKAVHVPGEDSRCVARHIGVEGWMDLPVCIDLV